MELNLRLLEQIVLGHNEDDFTKTLFDRLHTREGKQNSFKYFKERCNSSQQMDENNVINFLRELTNLNDFEILDVFDIFDGNYTGFLNWKSFYTMLAAYTALASRQTVKFLYKHGPDMFMFLCHHTSSLLDFEQFTSLGFVLGIPEQSLIQSILKDFKVNDKRLREQPIDEEHFTLYYYTTLRKLDLYGSVTEYTVDDLVKSSPLCACTIS
eukprot:TRINITY_DN4494_c0_g1_i6.p1 TRINITY_DN4494_c0_g1~~TRINITY_DN4494_c0_g1_i6.p1  ORF type:complete len:211 (+),score=31.28 TRINITY_DN4494_c0_g1_i6:757-1389(+)